MDSEVKLKVKGYDMITHSNGKELHKTVELLTVFNFWHQNIKMTQ